MLVLTLWPLPNTNGCARHRSRRCPPIPQEPIRQPANRASIGFVLQEVVPAPSIFVVVVSARDDIATCAQLSKDSNPVCAADSQSLCGEYHLQSPSTSLPNWPPFRGAASIYGVLGNFALKPWSFDTIFEQARLHGVHAGVSASPWFVNPIKASLPHIDGDGRVSSSAGGAYETTGAATTVELDSRRLRVTSDAMATNAASTGGRQLTIPAKYGLS